MVMSSYSKQRAISLHSQGENITSIVDHLALEDGVKVSKQGVRNFLSAMQYIEALIERQAQECPSKIPSAIKCIIEDTMCRDDEISATQILGILAT